VYAANTRSITYLEQPQHIKHWCVCWDAGHIAHIKLADAWVAGAAPELQQLLHQHQPDDVLLVVAPAVCNERLMLSQSLLSRSKQQYYVMCSCCCVCSHSKSKQEPIHHY
jgi:hypothetical protein